MVRPLSSPRGNYGNPVPMIYHLYRRLALILCFFLSLLSAGSLVLYLLLFSSRNTGIFPLWVWLGRALFESFHYASFFVPFYFASCGFLLRTRPFRLDRIVLLNLLLIPFFTLSLALRLLFSNTVSSSPLPALFQRSFTALGED